MPRHKTAKLAQEQQSSSSGAALGEYILGINNAATQSKAPHWGRSEARSKMRLKSSLISAMALKADVCLRCITTFFCPNIGNRSDGEPKKPLARWKLVGDSSHKESQPLCPMQIFLFHPAGFCWPGRR
jgi:hypothetical protein